MNDRLILANRKKSGNVVVWVSYDSFRRLARTFPL